VPAPHTAHGTASTDLFTNRMRVFVMSGEKYNGIDAIFSET